MASKRKKKKSTKASAPALSSGFRKDIFWEKWRWVIWFVVTLAVLANLPDMMAGNFGPKTFWLFLTLGVAYLTLPPRKPVRLEMTPLGAFWLAYVAWACIALLWSPSRVPSLERLINLFFLPSLGYLLARRVRFWESDRFWLWYAGLVGLVALVGVLQVIFPDAPLLGDLSGTGRPRTTMGQRNYASMYFLLNLPPLVWRWGKSQGRQRLFYGACVMLVAAFILLARTRSVWLGLAMGLFATGIIAWRLHASHVLPWLRRWPVILVGGLLVVTSTALVMHFAPETSKQALGGKARLGYVFSRFFEGANRFEMWSQSLEAANPWIGAGPGVFPVAITMADTHDKKVKTLNWEAHNDYLQAFLDLGFPGLILFCAFHAMLLWLIWRMRRDGLALAVGAALVGFMVVEGFTFLSEKVSSVITLSGLVAILAGRARQKPVFSRAVPVWLPALGWRTVGVLLLIGAFWMTQAIQTDRMFRATQNTLLGLGDLDPVSRRETLLEARRDVAALARKVAPATRMNANMLHIYSHQFIDLARQMEDETSLELFAQRALELHPADRKALSVLIQARLKESDMEEARKYLERVHAIWGPDPYDRNMQMLVQVYQLQGEQEKASSLRQRMQQYRVGVPKQPMPANRSQDAEPASALEWEPCSAAETYAVTLWSEGEQKPRKPQYTGLIEPRFELLEVLEPGRVYFWQVDAVGKYATSSSPVWFFAVAG